MGNGCPPLQELCSQYDFSLPWALYEGGSYVATLIA